MEPSCFSSEELQSTQDLVSAKRSRASPRSTKAIASLSKTVERTPVNIEEIAMLQEEIKRIDSQLNSLHAVEANAQAFLDDDENNTNGAAGMPDPTLTHMLVVELCQLCALGDAKGVRILLRGGADPNSRDYYGSPLLHIAAINGQLTVIKTLLELGADCTALDSRGCTVMDVAEENGYFEITEVLSNHLCGKERNTGLALDCKMERFNTSKDLSTPSSQLSLPLSSIPQPMAGELIVIMVGLPGRGKSYVGQQIRRYFQWNGLRCKVFSHQSYQRNYLKRCGLDRASPSSNVTELLVQADVGNKVILEIAAAMTAFLSNTDAVAILDGTNTTNGRRQAILRAIKERKHIKQNRIIFVEIVTNDSEKIRRNIMRAREMHSDPPDNFEKQYYENIAKHELVYETLNPIRDSELSYIQIQDNDLCFLNMISGWMPSRLAYILHNLNPSQENVYLTRAGEYVNLINGRIGGNSELTSRGMAYSIALFNFFKEEIALTKPLMVISSSSTRCVQTVRCFADESNKRASELFSSPSEKRAEPIQLNCRVDYVPTLDDLNYGDCEGQLLTDIQKTMMSTLQAIQADPYATPWPNGECIQHVFNTRLEPHIHDIQASSTPVLVVSHRTLLQGLYAYLVTKDSQVVAPQNAYHIKIPLESVVRIRVVGVYRVAEMVNLSKEVDRIELERTGKISSAAQVDINKYLSLSQQHSNFENKSISKAPG